MRLEIISYKDTNIESSLMMYIFLDIIMKEAGCWVNWRLIFFFVMIKKEGTEKMEMFAR